MTVYTIEVRANAEQYDILARQVAREILQLPGSSDHQGPLHQPLSVRTAQLYHLTGSLSPSQLDQLTHTLLIDPVTQIAIISPLLDQDEDNEDQEEESQGGGKGEDQGEDQDDGQGGGKPRPYPTTDQSEQLRPGYGRGLPPPWLPALRPGYGQEAQKAGRRGGSPPRPSSSWQPLDNTIVDVFYHTGVTDTLAESVQTGASMLGISGIEQVSTGHRYYLDGRLTAGEVRQVTESLLYNPVIQQYELHPVGTRFIASSPTASSPTASSPTASSAATPYDSPLANAEADAINRVPTYIPITSMSDAQLLDVSKKGLLALNLDEMRAIQRHFSEDGREPTDVELETLAQTWSEHCSHKTFKATIEYREVDADGNTLNQETINGLLKSYIMLATQQVARPWVVSAFSDNAGIVRFTETQDIAFKVETHNHPSAIEPFGGANTGVGGVIRDVLGVSAQPIACTDILCFGPPDTSSEELPAGLLTPRRIAGGVVNGVRDYGNKMGIPTVNGAILYHPGYLFNPLVFCGCLGILPRNSHPRRVQPGDRIVVLGGRTGRDGIHGATFSSGEMSSETNAQAGSAVQIGAPITEKKVADAIIQARDRKLYSAITDCGAGGFSSAIGEMGADTGAYVELEKTPLKYQGLTPWEIWLSEAQERMVLAVPPQHLEDLLAICAIEEVEASIIGTFTNSHHLVVTYQGQTVANLPMSFLHDGRPDRTLEAVWIHTSNINAKSIAPLPGAMDFALILINLLSHPTIASKESVVRRYDHEVQGATVLKPLVGPAGNGPGDAAILQPILSDVGTRFIASSSPSPSSLPSASPSSSHAGIILSNGINPLYGQFDPYWMAMNAVDEALRNLTAVGGDIERAAILDNFCWGNPTDPTQLGMLVRAVKGCHDAAIGFGVPFISGKDSLNNEYRANGQRLPVIPTLLISALGTIDDAAQSVDMSLKQPGNLLYLIGQTHNELAGSHYFEVSLPEKQTRAGAGSVARAGASPARTLYDRSVSGYGRGLPPPWSDEPVSIPDTTIPHVDVATARTTMNAIGNAIRAGLVQSCHDLSEGGLAVAAAEMALAGLLGLTIDIEHMPRQPLEYPDESQATILLFSESASRFLVEVAPQQKEAFEAHMQERHVDDVACLGSVTEHGRFQVRQGNRLLIELAVDELQTAWKGEPA